MTKKTDSLNQSTTVGDIAAWLMPALFAGVVLIFLVMSIFRVSGSGELYRYDFDTFGKIPVSEDGRVKPIDTVARNTLLMLSGKQSLSGEMLLEGEGTEDKPAVVWLAEVIASRPEAMQRKVIRIDDPGVLGLLGKTPEDGKYYSFGEFLAPQNGDPEASVYFEVGRLAEQAEAIRDDQRTQFQEHIIGLKDQLSMIGSLRAMLRPYVVPPVRDGQDWSPLMTVEQGAMMPTARDREPAKTWLDMMDALNQDNPQSFNTAAQAHLSLVSGIEPGPSKKAAFERGFNRYRPFVKGVVFYILAGLLGLAAMLLRPVLPAGWYTAVWRSALGVLAVTFLLHTAALLVRIWLQGRPPVTNLYSSAVFIGWALVGGSILLEKISKLGVASLAASAGGVSTLIVAHNLAKDGDTMGVMQAVLDSNFWLGTHVITITLGYAATFLAGFIALLYILFGMATPILDRKAARAMAGMVYATVCFALLFSFVGTVLGGIWADQSWGRFWGWDPKENGAILIVLMNAIILHARWGQIIKERGLMVLAIAGNIVTAWSWFGTNLLGVGLHSYGFMDGAMLWLAAFAASQMLIMGIALLVPTHLWWSFRKPRKVSDKPLIEPGDRPTAAPAAGG